MSNKTILEVKNLSVLIKERFLIKNINFSMEEGQCFGVIGEDKSGKTSLLKAIDDALPISVGQVIVDGEDIKLNKASIAKVNICLDPPVFFKFQTVYENMKYLSSLSGNYSKESILNVLNKFNLAHKYKTRVVFLSYYEKKLMALALAFLTEPKILLLDEPFKSLPPHDVKEIKQHIREIQSKGTAIILSSQEVETIEDLCEKFIFMEHKMVKEILSNDQYKSLNFDTDYAFVQVKYPNYSGKLIIDNFNLDVKLLGKKVLFEADETETSKIVRFLTKQNIAIYKAGYLNKKAEKIFADLTPYFKEESNE